MADWQGTSLLRRRTWPLSGHRLFVLGDAAGYVEPFTGEGITWALSAATEVAPLVRRSLHVWKPAVVKEWAALLRHRVWRGQRVCKALAWSVRSPWIVGGALAALEKFPWLALPVLRQFNHLPARLLEGSR